MGECPLPAVARCQAAQLVAGETGEASLEGERLGEAGPAATGEAGQASAASVASAAVTAVSEVPVVSRAVRDQVGKLCIPHHQCLYLLNELLTPLWRQLARCIVGSGRFRLPCNHQIRLDSLQARCRRSTRTCQPPCRPARTLAPYRSTAHTLLPPPELNKEGSTDCCRWRPGKSPPPTWKLLEAHSDSPPTPCVGFWDWPPRQSAVPCAACREVALTTSRTESCADCTPRQTLPQAPSCMSSPWGSAARCR